MKNPNRFWISIITSALCVLLPLFANAVSNAASSVSNVGRQPVIGARNKAILKIDGHEFKDANGNGVLDAYEDWRLPVEKRVNDLVSKMNIEEKAGMMLIDTLGPAFGGAVDNPADDYINNQKMTRFIFRNVVTATPVRATRPMFGNMFIQPVTPTQAAIWINAIQQMAETTGLGIPVVFKSNARNHYERESRFGINTDAGSFSEWPKEAGLAATRDMALIKDFALTMGAEWKSIGLRGMYGYMADTATEPRWYRVHETFSEDVDLNAKIIKTLVENLQGGALNPDSYVALTIKHFPGGGPQELGLDPHFSFGKTQVYPAGKFGAHMKPFIAAIKAGASSFMPYYGVPINLTYQGVKYEQLGMAFSKQIVNDLLRSKLGFKGYVNSDTGIVTTRAWGLESKTVPERVATAINSGTDVLSGFNDKQTIIDLVKSGLVSEARINEAVARLLKEQFQLGLFENPYVDANKAQSIIGNDAFRAKALDAQRKSIVLLQNNKQNHKQAAGNTLPLPKPTATQPVTLYTMGLNAKVVEEWGYQVIDGDMLSPATQTSRPSAAGADYAVIRVEVSNPRNVTGTYKSNDPTTDANSAYISPITGKPFGAADPDGVDDNLIYGGALPWEVGNISFTSMAASKSWQISPSLDDIKAVMNEIGANKTILTIYFRQPYVLDAESGLKNAGAILAGFGVSDSALMDIITGKFKPKGKLPFALAKSLQAVIDNDPDAPGYPKKDTLFPFGFGLKY